MDRAVPRIAAFARDAATMRWIREELHGTAATIEVVVDVSALMTMVADENEDAHALLIDFNEVTRAQILDLLLVQRKSSGMIIGIGSVSVELKRQLDMEHVLERPLGSETLRKIIGDALEKPRRRRRATDVIPSVK